LGVGSVLLGLYVVLMLIDSLVAGLCTAMPSLEDDLLLVIVKALLLFAECVVYLSTGVLFMIWFRRVRRNLDAAGVTSLQNKPRECVWGFINPITFLYQPIVIAEEIWKSTTPLVIDPLVWKRLKGPALLFWWWLLFISGALADQFVRGQSRALKGNAEVIDVVNLHYAMLAANVLSIAATVLAILVVRKLTARQEAKYQEYVSTSLSPNVAGT
jgi:hypothetical protein